MFSRIGTCLIVVASLLATAARGPAVYGQVTIGQRAETSVEGIVPSEDSVVASKLDFRNSVKLLVRQWSLLDHGADTEVMRLYRIGPGSEVSHIRTLLKAASSGGDVVLMTQAKGGDNFVGRYLAIDSAASVASADVFLSWAGDVLASADETAEDGERGIFVATPSVVDGWAPESDVVFFDFVFGGGGGGEKVRVIE